jgi:hypothetical protein
MHNGMKGLFLQKPLTAMRYFYLFLELYRRRVLSEWVFVVKRLEGGGRGGHICDIYAHPPDEPFTI